MKYIFMVKIETWGTHESAPSFCHYITVICNLSTIFSSYSTASTFYTSDILFIYAILRLENCKISDIIKAQRRTLLFKGFQNLPFI